MSDIIIKIIIIILREPFPWQLQAKVFTESPYCAVKWLYSYFIIYEYRAIFLDSGQLSQKLLEAYEVLVQRVCTFMVSARMANCGRAVHRNTLVCSVQSVSSGISNNNDMLSMNSVHNISVL